MTRSLQSWFILLFLAFMIFCGDYFPLLAYTHKTHPLDEISPREKSSDGTPVELNIKLSVRVIAPGNGITPVKYREDRQKEDFTVLVAGRKKPVLDFAIKKRSIAESAAGRQFILSFDAADYTAPLANAVNHFVRHILAPSDRLLLRSPLHTYQIDANFSKEEIITYIETNLQKDCRQWKENKKRSLADLDQTLETLEKKLAAKRVGMNSILLFINNYTHQWRKFDKEFLLSGLEQYPEMASLAAQNPGEKWAIHFQERDLLPMLNRYRRLADRVKTHIAALPKSHEKNAALIRSSLDKIETSMLFTEDFPLEELANVFLGVNINYNVIFFTGRDQEQETGDTVSLIPGYEQILREISRQSGGNSLELNTANPNPAQHLDTIARHVDVYYELAFPVGAEPGDKNIEIQVNPAGTTAYYKNKFKKEELKWLLEWVVQEINLAGVTLEANRLSFTVSGFKMNQNAEDPAGRGLVKIEIRLSDDKNTVVYRTANTMRPVETMIKISLTIPDTFKGYYKLTIAVQDLAAGKNREVSKYVKIS